MLANAHIFANVPHNRAELQCVGISELSQVGSIIFFKKLLTRPLASVIIQVVSLFSCHPLVCEATLGVALFSHFYREEAAAKAQKDVLCDESFLGWLTQGTCKDF